MMEVPTGNWRGLVFRTDVAPFSDIRVRQAVRMAADRGELVKLIMGGSATIACDTPVKPDDQYRADIKCPQDIAGAKKLLSEAAKYYASTQVVDEARHVEVFAQYLDQKMGGINYPVNHHLKALLDDIIKDSRWDITYLGMQIMVEGLALAAFGFMHQTTEEPLLKKLLRYVMSDEARHVAFGVLSLQEIYKDMDAKEIRERQEFTFEAALRMRDRFLRQEMWEKLGVDVKEMVKYQLEMPEELKVFQRLLFSKIVPNCKKLGLLDAGDGWLRDRFTEIGVIEFENWVDTGSEYEDFDLDKSLEEKDKEVLEAAHEVFHKEEV
jgi:hypothetical protein